MIRALLIGVPAGAELPPRGRRVGQFVAVAGSASDIRAWYADQAAGARVLELELGTPAIQGRARALAIMKLL